MEEKLKVIVACEFSGTVRDAFLALGHDAVSCDLLPTEVAGPHIQGDIKDVDLTQYDLMIAHPPCTHLSVAGARYFKDKEQEQKDALDFVRYLLDAPVPRIAIENPVSVISTRIRKASQYVQPYEYGDSYSKKTGLWLKNLPLLQSTNLVDKGEMVTFSSGRTMPKWYADAFRLPKEQRWRVRSRFSPGIAKAMAEQWGSLGPLSSA